MQVFGGKSDVKFLAARARSMLSIIHKFLFHCVQTTKWILQEQNSQVHTFTQNLREDSGHNKYII